jgi:hypothetical protein
MQVEIRHYEKAEDSVDLVIPSSSVLVIFTLGIFVLGNLTDNSSGYYSEAVNLGPPD